LHSARTTGIVEAINGDTGAIRRVGRITALIGFTAVGAQLAVWLPFTPVPITMQTLFVLLAGITLGPRDGFFAMCSYIVLGVSGLPLFAGFSFGPAVLVGPTGGYLLSFPAAALLAGAVSARSGGRVSVMLGAFSGTALIIVAGALHLLLLSGRSLSMVVPLAITPFLAGDAVKAVTAVLLAGRR